MKTAISPISNTYHRILTDKQARIGEIPKISFGILSVGIYSHYHCDDHNDDFDDHQEYCDDQKEPLPV